MAAEKASAVPSLRELQGDIAKLSGVIHDNYRVSPALTFAKQKLKEAGTALEQEMRNVTIEAQEEARRLEAAAKKAL